MKNTWLILISSLIIFQSCEDCNLTVLEDPLNFECPDLMLNIGDACDDGNPDTDVDIINSTCECVGGSTFDCPDLSLNIGDPCDDGNPDTDNDVINGNCECVGGNQIFDCPDLMLNIGDACTDNDDTTINDMVSNDCECIGTSIFDCPDLNLNIGDACDDGNPDTDDDVVNDMCVCEGIPIILGCDGILYVSRIEPDAGGNANGWFFDKADKLSSQVGSFSNVEQKNNGFLSAEGYGTNAAAFDYVNNKYVMAYQYDLGFPNPLYVANPNVFSSTFLDQEASYGAPVFLNGELYAINIFYDAPTVQYSIVRIDQSTGIPTVLFNDNITVNSPMINFATSSTSDQMGLIYFMSYTNLIVFDPTTISSTFVDIDPSYNADNQIAYTGLEYKLDENLVLAMKLKSTGSDKVADLVSISSDGNYTVNTIFDIKQNLGAANDEEISFLFHSTTYSQCDNIYYISELVELDVDPIESFLIEIDLDNNTLNEQVFPDFIYGLEIVDN